MESLYGEDWQADSKELSTKIEQEYQPVSYTHLDVYKRQETITDAAGRCIRVETEQRGFITRISLETIKGTEMLVVYDYDKDGNMMSITDALGQTTHILLSVSYTHLVKKPFRRRYHIP